MAIEEVSMPVDSVEPSIFTDGACVHSDPSIFHIDLEKGRNKERENQAKMDAALRYCAQCTLRLECGIYEQSSNPAGLGGLRVYGGRVLGLVRDQERRYKTTVDHLLGETN